MTPSPRSQGSGERFRFSSFINGLFVKERRYLRRAVFVVDREGKLTYVAYMQHNGLEPNYAEVIAAAKKALV